MFQKADYSEVIEIQKTDLNGDGQKEFVVRGRYNSCGEAGNCIIWIYEKKNGTFRQILQSYGYKDKEGHWFEMEKDRSNGYQSLVLRNYFTAFETIYNFYKFNGKKYIENKCLVKDYFIDKEMPTTMTCEESNEQSVERLRENRMLFYNQQVFTNLENN